MHATGPTSSEADPDEPAFGPSETRSLPLRRAVAAGARMLAAAGVDAAGHDAEALAAHVLGADRQDLVRFTEIPAGPYRRLIARRAAREPLQHITGLAHFRRVSLRVGPGVFIPRPETELLAGRVIEELRTHPAPPGPSDRAHLVVDLGTGSGAIALAVAVEVPGAEVHAVEVCQHAYDWASVNLRASGVRLHLADAADALPHLDATVDVVVSNPPYIPHEAWESVQREVRDHDPPEALWGGGPDGLAMIRTVERTAARLLRAGGLVAVEHAEAQSRGILAVFARSGSWTHVADHPDLTGRDRFLTARRVRVSP